MGRVRTRQEPSPSSSGPYRTVPTADRKSTRLNSSNSQISYAVFCLKKINNNNEYLVLKDLILDFNALISHSISKSCFNIIRGKDRSYLSVSDPTPTSTRLFSA